MSVYYSVSKRTATGLTSEDFYAASLQYEENNFTLSTFAQHIADHGCSYDAADIYAILTKAVQCIRELCMEGYRVQLGDLGTFYASIKSQDTVPVSEYATVGFTASNITDIQVKLRAGDALKDLRDEMTLVQVLTRQQQADYLASQKETAVSESEEALSQLSGDALESTTSDTITNAADEDDDL